MGEGRCTLKYTSQRVCIRDSEKIVYLQIHVGAIHVVIREADTTGLHRKLLKPFLDNFSHFMVGVFLKQCRNFHSKAGLGLGCL